jgi:hypothetical protein
MLTEIEWWGGLLFIWMGLLYYWLGKAYKEDSMLAFLVSTIAHISAATVLALFFYTLDTPTIQYVYVGAIVLGIPLSILMFWWPDKDEEDSESPDGKESEEDEEEDSKGLEILANLLLYTPIVVTFGLGIYKASEFREILPFLN